VKIQGYQQIPFKFNLTTAIGPLYSDGGSGLVVVVALLWGAWTGQVTRRFRDDPSGPRRLLLGVAIVAALNSPFDLYLNNLSTIFQVVCIMTLIRRSARPSSFSLHGPLQISAKNPPRPLLAAPLISAEIEVEVE